MSFNQEKLDKVINQSRSIFDIFIYRSDTDTLADIQVAGYFDASRFVGESGWDGGQIQIKAADGFATGFIDVATGSFTPSTSAASYGGFYVTSQTFTGASGGIDVSLLFGSAVAKDLDGFSLEAGGGLKNLGAAGWFRYTIQANNAANNSGIGSAGTTWDLGARVRLADDTTFKTLVRGGRGTIYAGNIPITSSYSCRVYVETGETVFMGGAWVGNPSYGITALYSVDIVSL